MPSSEGMMCVRSGTGDTAKHLSIYLLGVFLFNMGGLVHECLRISTGVLPKSRPMSSSHMPLIWRIFGLADSYFLQLG